MQTYEPLLKLFSNQLADYSKGLSLRQPKELYEPEAYILSLGGKRLRPLLALIACDLFDKDPALALNSALAVELFHNFSLIHDDILDEAPLRRNQATVHHKWNTNIAILSGDAMLVKAFQALSAYDASEYKQLSHLLQSTAIEVCEGQQMDMNFERDNVVGVDDYVHMITLKTAVLLGCSLKMGAMAAGAGTEDQDHLYAFGKNLGVAFQLLDDYLDAFAKDAGKFGKQPGGDILANKKTFLLLKCAEKADATTTAEIARLMQLKDPAEKVSAMLRIFSQLGVGDLCLAEADAFTKKAIDCLEQVNASSKKKNALRQMALELLNRQV